MARRVAIAGDVTVPKQTNAPIPAWSLVPLSGRPPGDRFCGPLEDVSRLEGAIVDAQASGRRRIVLLRYDPHELLDTTIPLEDLQPVASGVAVQVDTAGQRVSIRRIDDWPTVVH
jgi:hypothetical protein